MPMSMPCSGAIHNNMFMPFRCATAEAIDEHDEVPGEILDCASTNGDDVWSNVEGTSVDFVHEAVFVVGEVEVPVFDVDVVATSLIAVGH